MRHIRHLTLLLTTLALAGVGNSYAANPVVVMTTNLGEIQIEVDPKAAPLSAENFLRYAREGFYDGTVFHRVIPGFVIQGGGYDKALNKKKTHDPIKNESKNGEKNLRGALSMARTSDPHSATSQFFINLVDNAFLDPQGSRWGYAVFGRVTSGMDVVDKIAALPTGAKGRFGRDVPQEDAIIKTAVVK